MPRDITRRSIRSLRPLLALPALGVLLTLGACASTLTLPESRPDDYTMLVTVYPAPGEAADPAFRPARYAIESDGLLRAEVGAGVIEPGFPPIARRLEPAQIDALYALARDANPTEAPRVPGPTVYQPPQGSRVAVIEIGSRGRYRAHELPASPGSPAGPLIRELARLSWLDR
jgi:hypothetical protein